MVIKKIKPRPKKTSFIEITDSIKNKSVENIILVSVNDVDIKVNQN